MSGIIGGVGSKSGLVREFRNESELWHYRYTGSLTINSANQNIPDLAVTYNHPTSHVLHITGCLTMTSDSDFDSHIGVKIDGTQIGSPDQHYVPDGEWWYFSWSFMTPHQNAGTHAVTAIGTNQMGDFNIVGTASNSQQVVRIVPLSGFAVGG